MFEKDVYFGRNCMALMLADPLPQFNVEICGALERGFGQGGRDSMGGINALLKEAQASAM